MHPKAYHYVHLISNPLQTQPRIYVVTFQIQIKNYMRNERKIMLRSFKRRAKKQQQKKMKQKIVHICAHHMASLLIG